MLLKDNEVHLWIVHMDAFLPHYLQLKAQLSERELSRESRFAFDHLKKHYTISQSILRNLLQRYTGQAAASIEYVHGPKGKPYLKDNPQHIQFNLSHSKSYALYGFTVHCEIGVDIEFIRKDCLKDNLEELVLTESEKRTFYTLSGQAQTEAFFLAWTQKEATLKALGVGITVPMQNVEINLAHQIIYPKESKILELADDPHPPHLWSLFAFNPIPGYAGAVTVKSPAITLRIFDSFELNAAEDPPIA